MHWYVDSEAAKCFPCSQGEELHLKLITKYKGDDAFTVSGFVNWKKAAERLDMDEKSEYHGESLKTLSNYSNTPVIPKVSRQGKDTSVRNKLKLIVKLLLKEVIRTVKKERWANVQFKSV